MVAAAGVVTEELLDSRIRKRSEKKGRILDIKFCFKKGTVIYLAGSITGVADYKERFARAEFAVRSLFDGQVKVWNPAKLPAGKSKRWYMRRCLQMVLGCDAVYAQRCWWLSGGACVEIALARYCGIPVVQEDVAAGGKEVCDGVVN